jgi:cytochrome c
MATFEWNKIIASVLMAMIVAMVSGILATFVVHPARLENPVYMPPGAAEGAKGAEAAAAAAAANAAPKLDPIGPALAKADATKGEQITKVCQQCHTFGKGEPNKIGPNLFGVFGGPIAEDRGGYEFSDALQTHKGAKWTPDLLNVWLNGPQDFAAGTKMSFPGLPKVQDRADVVKYLETLK